ncbi:alpha/beta fold hydrolase [Ohtaekwangia koreensis]|uniref:Pimeloyl-ACP methyl ester carboxylesterase n=1 Tax=Ohtaekwangia koreensis TaxID=688867 RepID=A0A1T5LSS4_9BACT|nr:alpha/beta hydrolase [Ohtaekwangia koreensis]SKC78990.1 Pimeloyl-ACP methyl ester carboxylesterase [Ohtaekwangia koreensis]
MKVYLTLIVILTAFLSHAQQKLIKVNGHNLNIYQKGFENRKKNAPAIIFENGMGVGLGNWDTVIDQIAKFAPVFAYDRSGVEKSDKVYQMPTVKVVADNLKSLLTTLNISPPYILVGHSMGGVYIRAFAGFYPNDIAALVFVDPADFTETKQQWNSIFRAIGVPEKKIDEMLYNRLYTKSEVDSLNFGPWSEAQVLADLRRTDFAEINNLPLPNVPIYFLVGGRFDVPPERRSKDFDQEYFFKVKSNQNMERWRKVIDSSGKGGALIYLPKSGHYIQRDDPKAVINTIKYIVENW